MAYLQTVVTRCKLCSRKAAVELIDWRNESCGKFCRICGNKALKARQEFEDTHNHDGSLQVKK